MPPVNSSKSAPPPFWQQLPRVFTYPMHGDAIVKIVAFALFVALTSHIGFFAWILSRIAWLAGVIGLVLAGSLVLLYLTWRLFFSLSGDFAEEL